MERLQVLVATMHQNDFSKVESMRLSSDAVFANQADRDAYEEREYPFGTVKMVTTRQRGVGKNRNTAFQFADGDILLMADDDIRYVDGYVKLITDEFGKNPQADAMIFNIRTIGESTDRRTNTGNKKVRLFNALNYGAVRIAVRREKLERAGISFSLNFGGGALYSAGEDSLFIRDMVKKGLRIYTSPVTIAEVDQTSSTWFKGYNHKYFYDKGAAFSALFGRFAYLYALQDFIRHMDEYRRSDLGKAAMISDLRKGIAGYRSYRPYPGERQSV